MAQVGGQQGIGLIWLVLVLVIFYFLLIRPQQKRARDHQKLVEETNVGDRIVTVGGIHGTVKQIADKTVTIEIAKGTSVVFSKSAIAAKEQAEEASERSKES